MNTLLVGVVQIYKAGLLPYHAAKFCTDDAASNQNWCKRKRQTPSTQPPQQMGNDAKYWMRASVEYAILGLVSFRGRFRHTVKRETLQVHAKGKSLAPSVDLSSVARFAAALTRAYHRLIQNPRYKATTLCISRLRVVVADCDACLFVLSLILSMNQMAVAMPSKHQSYQRFEDNRDKTTKEPMTKTQQQKAILVSG
eukprot:1935535-Amphidinium_carterae.1